MDQVTDSVEKETNLDFKIDDINKVIFLLVLDEEDNMKDN